MADKADQEAKQLLPCLKNLVITCRPDYLCATCKRRSSVASALRERDAELDKLRAIFASVAPTNSQGYEGLLATGQALIDKDAEIERLKAALEETK